MKKITLKSYRNKQQYRRSLFKKFIVAWVVTIILLSMLSMIKNASTYEVRLKRIETELDTERIISEYNEWVRQQNAEQERIELEKKYSECQVELQAKQDKVNKAKEFVSSYTGGKSPLINHIDKFYEGDELEGEIALAIAGNESLFGIHTNYYNAWGYGCNWNGVRFDCGWRDWNYAVKRYKEVAHNYLSIYDGSKESIRQIANAGYYKVGMDGSSIENQNNWVNNVYWFTEQI